MKRNNLKQICADKHVLYTHVVHNQFCKQCFVHSNLTGVGQGITPLRALHVALLLASRLTIKNVRLFVMVFARANVPSERSTPAANGSSVENDGEGTCAIHALFSRSMVIC